MNLTIDTGEQNAIPHMSLGFHWLLQLKFFDLMADEGSL
jgi:hypothetical protein